MKKFWMILPILAVMAGCSSEDGPKDNPQREESSFVAPEVTIQDGQLLLSRQQKDSGDELMDFSWHVLKRMKGANKTVAPVGLASTMTMALNAMDGDTYAELAKVMGVVDIDAANEFNYKVLNALPKLDHNVKVTDASALYALEGKTVQPQYLDLLKRCYEIEYFTLQDFGTEANAIKKINSWCSGKTSGLIPEVLDKDFFYNADNLRITMAWVNACYFSGSWTYGFDEAMTQKGEFQNAKGSAAQVDMMWNLNLYKYAEIDGMQAVSLDFGNYKDEYHAFEALFFLPAEGMSVDDAIANIANASVASVREKMAEEIMIVKLPKFSVSLDNDLLGLIESMGAKTMCSSRADLSKGTTVESKIEKIYQKIAFEIDENGATGAAGSVVAAIEIAHDPDGASEYKTFQANRPFVYAVCEKSTGAILFAGVVDSL